MHPALVEAYEFFQMYASLRNELMEILTDTDLAFTPGGENLTLGELCVEIGETEVSYIHSFRTFTQNFDYRAEPAGLSSSVAALREWYARLDGELEQVLGGLTAVDVETRKIDRGGNFLISPRIQLEIYKEALLIFYGKVMVYLKALEKPRPKSWSDWIV